MSTDPAIEKYLPEAPVSDEAKKRNGNLPGMGGVFSPVNLATYHYAGNNPVKYVDPNGKESRYFTSREIEIIREVLGPIGIESISNTTVYKSVFPSFI